MYTFSINMLIILTYVSYIQITDSVNTLQTQEVGLKLDFCYIL